MLLPLIAMKQENKLFVNKINIQVINKKEKLFILSWSNF